MNLLEAIQNAGEDWFRPVGWKKVAFSRASNLIFYEGIKDSVIGLKELYRISDLTGEWEIVTPEQVLSERKS